MQEEIKSYYEILGVADTTPISQIRLARKKLLAEIHPDRFDFGDERRQDAEEQAKIVNEAFEGIRNSRATPQSITPKIVKPVEEVKVKSRKRLETVESRVVVRDGKVVMLKRKRTVKFAKLKDFRDIAQKAVLTTIDGFERKIAEKKLKQHSVANTAEAKRSRVVHIVEGAVSVESI